jgi:anti-anti-sigma factor
VRNAELLTRVCGGYAVALLRGELDTTDAESAAGAVAALTAGGRPLIIDLGTLDFIDCHAAGALLGVRKTALQAGGDVLLAAPHGPVLRLLTLLEAPGVHSSVAAAADSVGRRDARGREVSTPRSGRVARPGAWYRRPARRAPAAEAGAGAAVDRSWPPRWLRARAGLHG